MSSPQLARPLRLARPEEAPAHWWLQQELGAEVYIDNTLYAIESFRVGPGEATVRLVEKGPPTADPLTAELETREITVRLEP